MWPFGRRTFLASEDEAWFFETWRYFLRNLGGISDLNLSPLVTPSRDFFPPTAASGHERAEHVFKCVQEHARLGDWHCRLVAQPVRPQTRVDEFLVVQHLENETPLGTFSVEGNEVVITYDPGVLDNTFVLVATLVHELAHYLLLSLHEEQPGGEEMHEFATDLLTVYMGFGLFGANSAFNFRQHGDFMSQGWQSSRQGYLGEREWAFALAIFLELRHQPADAFKKFLKPHLKTDIEKARRYLRRQSKLLAALEQEDGSGVQPQHRQ